MRVTGSQEFSAPISVPWQLASRAANVARCCSARIPSGPEEPAATKGAGTRQRMPSPPVLLRDIFTTNRGSDWSSVGSLGAGKRGAPLQRLDRLQEVASLALEGREQLEGERWGCADIGTDHGLLAICLHANGASVVAGDRAAEPLRVARANVSLYLQRVRDCSSTGADPMPGEASLVGNRVAGSPDAAAGFAAPVEVPRLECRLGDGLAVLEEGEVDTVCIAGVGVKTMIQILSAEDRTSLEGHRRQELSHAEEGSVPYGLGVRRLVLQPMDARLEYMRGMRVWLRENGWKITEETLVSTPGKGGNHAFLTLRADWAGNLRDLPNCDPGRQEQSDWLGDFLPARAIGIGCKQGQRERQEAARFLAYLRHQRDWLRAIERARSPRKRDSFPSSQGEEIPEMIDKLVAAVEKNIQRSGVADEEERLVTARRWQKAATTTPQGTTPEAVS